MAVVGVGSAAAVDPVASLVTALNAATAATTAAGTAATTATATLAGRQVIAGTGLTGGGTLAADRTFTVDFASSGVTSSTKAVRADDSRLSDVRLSQYDVRNYGTVDTTGVADSSTAVLAAITAAYTAGGGEVVFPVGTIRIDSQLAMPYASDPNPGSLVIPVTVPMVLRGAAGPNWDGFSEGYTLGGSVLDLRYNGSGPAKLDTRGSGHLTIRDLTFTNLGSADTKAIIQTTNTTLKVQDCLFLGHSTVTGLTCNQDAIVLGGTADTFGSGANDAFGGYGTVITRNMFERCRRGVYGRASCNAVVVSANIWGKKGGSDTTGAALQFDGTGAWGSYGNVVRDNLFEITHYSYAIRLTNASDNVFMGNGFYDNTTDFLFAYKIEGYGDVTTATNAGSGALAVCQGNLMFDGSFPWSLNGAKYLDTSGVTGTAVAPSHWSYRGTLRNFTLGDRTTTVQPRDASTAETSLILNVKRSSSDSTRGNGDVVRLQNNGAMKLHGAGSAVTLNDGTSDVVTFGNDASIVRATNGNFDLYPGPGSTQYSVRIRRGVLRIMDYTTAARPSASGAGAGANYYDTTLSKPAWSDGTNWRDAAGTIV